MRKLFLIVSINISFFACQKMQEKRVNITGAGSTFVYPLISKWAYEYYNNTKIQVNYQSIGSGGGIKQIIERTVDFGASDMPLEKSRLDSANLYQFPVIVGGISIVINLPNIKSEELKLDSITLCYIFLGKIQKWNDKRIKDLNPDLNLPDIAITPVRRSDGSGTTFLFTNYLSKVCPEWKEKVGYGTSVNWPVGIGAKGNEGVANYVKQNSGTIGYVEYAYAKENKLIYALVKNKAGKFLPPKLETFKEATKYANWKKEEHFYEVLTNEDGENTYPITGAVFILLPREKKDKNKHIVEFFNWTFQKGDSIAISLDYVPLSEEAKKIVIEYWNETILK
ncbi:MAG: phosphate ABC transporter substrate-binding protein PstS [candidate division WOR-3 bacterium]